MIKVQKACGGTQREMIQGRDNSYYSKQCHHARPSQPKQSSDGRGAASTHQPMVPANNQVKPSSSQHPN